MRAIEAIVSSRGRGFVAEVSHPNPLGNVKAEYEVPMKYGERGWRDSAGNWHKV